MTIPADSFADPFYYLSNFRQVLEWLRLRYSDVLSTAEHTFIAQFGQLPQPSQALLVRMVMRKGPIYRASKLVYAEIGETIAAIQPLLQQGWVDDQAPLSLVELFGVLGKTELLECFGQHRLAASARKSEWLESLTPHCAEPLAFAAWWPDSDDAVYALSIRDVCERLRLMFFGNLHQDWSQFVLTDLGLLRYEKVPLGADSRSLRSAIDVDHYVALFNARLALEAGAAKAPLIARVLALELSNAWLANRRDKLLYQVGQQCEREGSLHEALAIYQACAYPGSRVRKIRVLERLAQHQQALSLADYALAAPENPAEQQQLQRMLPRLRRTLGLVVQRARKASAAPRLDLHLQREGAPRSVEFWVQHYLHTEQGPVHYVENTLLNALFGLLCWPAIFAPLPGAFFHPFQSGPADLHQSDFQSRRAALFAQCLAELDDGRYAATVRERYQHKFGLQSPFVVWTALSPALLELALVCLPAAHLRLCFERMLEDLKANCSGLPDLIQFWPAQRSYRMIEVKGPGDRLQDNQLRWLEFFAIHDLPVEVCHVTWDDPQSLPSAVHAAEPLV